MPVSNHPAHLLALLLPVAACVAPASAQVRDVAPYYAVFAAKAPMHCGDSDRFYKVADVDAGVVVLADGEGSGWTRISYPAGVTAFARAEDVTVQGDTATLSRTARLKAPNAVAGYAASYKLIGPFAPGLSLKVVEPVREGEGPIVAYRVSAPADARGFVETRALRKASDAEVTAFRTKASLPALPGAAPAPVVTPPVVTTSAAPTAPASDKPAVLNLTQPAVTGDAGAATPPPVTPAPTQPAPTEIVQKSSDVPGAPAAAPGAPADAAPVITPVQPRRVERQVTDIERLEGSFQAVLRQPVLSAEVDELLNEYNRVLATDDGVRHRAQLEQRIGVLELRRDYRDRLRKLEEGRAQLDRDQVRLVKQLEEIEKSRYYTIVGELQPSLVYDGKRLPQMYRVVSVGGTSPRTLGYLRRTPEIDLDSMLGRVIGVIGEAQLDRSLQLNVIQPVHVDLLRSRPAAQPVEQAPPPAQPETQPLKPAAAPLTPVTPPVAPKPAPGTTWDDAPAANQPATLPESNPR